MPTITEENSKILRQALDVIVGLDIPFTEITGVTVSGNYAGSSGELNQSIQTPTLMDLSNGGFKNDGLAIPLDETTDGYVSQIGQPMTLTVTLAENSDNDLIIIGYIGGVMHKWRFTGSGSIRTATIPANTERIIANRVICGEAFWFDNAGLVSCNLQLRAVETKADNPELQMSEIEIQGYEPTDITNVIGYIGTGHPIYYTSGYPGDMAPIRKFYLGEPVELESDVVTIKGYDATYLLDEDFGGTYIGRPESDQGEGETDGVNSYFNRIADMIRNTGIDLEYVNTYTEERYNSPVDSYPVFIPKQPKRNVIAAMVNFFRYISWSSEHEPYDLPVYINYVDAGRPRMWTDRDETTAITLNHITRPKITAEPIIKTIEMNGYFPRVNSSAAIETVDVSGAKIVETSDPYYSFSASSGTLTRLGPYSYKIKGNGSITISGRKITYIVLSPLEPDDSLPMTTNSGTNGVVVTFDDILIDGGILGASFFNWDRRFQTLLARSNIIYEFDFRGDPRLQPRDYIKADIDGSGNLVDMTIDTIELKHEGGGTTSTITARRGFI